MDWRDEDGTEHRGWFSRLHLSWPMLFLAGWLLYEFTAQPGLAALVACAKFGWADVRTAFWLRRVDPDRPRGQACFWCYLTYGLWKVAVMATLTMIVLGLLNVIVERVAGRVPANNGFSPVLGGALAAAAMGFSLSFPTSYLALWSAYRNGVRIWLGHAPSRARKEHFWPPRDGSINAAPFVGLTTLMMTIGTIFLVVPALAVALQANGVGVLALTFGMMASLLFVPVAFFRLASQLIARSPQECWIIEEDEAVYQERGAEEEMSEA